MHNSNLLKLSLLLLLSPLSHADIVTDGSLGAATSLTGPEFAIGADLGQQRGGNLFHSFSQFDIASDESATFSGPADIANIISRVTGGELSTIDGLLRSDIAGVNLFLLNPAGVLFGPNASVDIGGSLYVSTGDYLLMDDMAQFLATPLQGEVLSTAAPAAFGFLDSPASAIQLQGAQLTLAPNSTLSLAAANVAVEQSAVTIDQGDVLINAMDHAGEIPIDSVKHTASAVPAAGAVTIDQSTISVDGASGGYIAVSGQQLTLRDSTLSSLTTGDDNGQNIAIDVDDFTFTRSRIDTTTQGLGAAGDITVQAGQITFDVTTNDHGFFSESIYAPTSVQLDITHTENGSLTAYLSNSSGTEVLLFSGVGGYGDNFSHTLFDDNAAQSISEGSTPFAGAYRPKEPLSTLNSNSLGGEWTLKVRNTSRRSGSLDAWRLSIGDYAFDAIETPVSIDAFSTITSTLVVPDDITVPSSHGGTIGITADSVVLAGAGRSPYFSVTGLNANLPGSLIVDVASVTRRGQPGAFVDTGLDSGYFTANTIVTDGSLGLGPLTAITPDADNVYHIEADMGQLEGDTLFHSFNLFDILPDFKVVFHGVITDIPIFVNGEISYRPLPLPISTIIARVTGNHASYIAGALETDPFSLNFASVFLLNPDGILFGPDASVDIGGSLHVSTGDYLLMDDTTQFMATPLQDETLSTAAPTAFGFLGDSAGAIQLRETDIVLTGNHTLSLVANGIEMQDADLAVTPGQLQMVAIRSGEVSVDSGAISDDAVLADVTLSNSQITLSSDPLSSVNRNRVWIQGNNIRLQDDSAIVTESSIIVSEQGFAIEEAIRAGDVYLDARDELSISSGGIFTGSPSNTGFSSNRSEFESFDFGAGKLSLEAGSITLEHGAQLDASTEGGGLGGDIHLSAQRQITLYADTGIITDSNGHRDVGPTICCYAGSSGAGNIRITAGELSLAGGQLSAQAPDSAMPGNLTLDITGHLSMSQDATLSTKSSARENAGGHIVINAGQLQMSGNAKIDTSDSLGAAAGDITIAVTEGIHLNGSGVAITAASNGSFFNPLTELREYTEADPVSGAITRRVEEVFAGLSAAGAGQQLAEGGTISLTGNQFTMASGAAINTSTSGQGHAGSVVLNIDGAVALRGDNTAISSASLGAGLFSGNAGAVEVNAETFTLSDGAAIRTTTATGGGRAGSIMLDVAGIVQLQGADTEISSLSASATNSRLLLGDVGGNAGVSDSNIVVSSDALWITDGARITATTTGAIDAGAIVLDIAQAVVLDQGSITSETLGENRVPPLFLDLRYFYPDVYINLSDAGDSGNITLSADRLHMERHSSISAASAGPGKAGSVTISTAEATTVSSQSVISTTASDTGDAGTVDVTANTLLIDGGTIASANAGAGIAGKVTLSVTEGVHLLNGATVSTETIDGFDADNPASIELSARDLLLDSGSSITTNAGGAADAGNIKLAVDKAIQLLGDSRVSTESAGGGGGGVNIMVNDLLYLQDGKITTNVGLGGGNGGDIFVDPTFIVLDNSVISANAVDGNGGNITLIADYIQRSTDSAITASSQLGIDGEINIEALDADVNTGEDNLSADFLDASQWQRQACSQRSGGDVSSFVIEQRPLRPAPHDDWSVSRELL